MFRRTQMTGGQIELKDLVLGIDDVNDPNFDNSGGEVEGVFGRGILPHITFRADPDNTDIIYLSEHASSGPDEMIRLRPGDSIQFDYSSYVYAMNVFYATGLGGDLLFCVVR